MKNLLLAALLVTLVMLASVPQDTEAVTVRRILIRRSNGFLYCVCTTRCRCVKVTVKKKTKRSVADSISKMAEALPPAPAHVAMTAEEAQRTLAQMALTCPQLVTSVAVNAAFDAADGNKDRRLNGEEMGRFEKALRAYEVCTA